MDEESIMNTGSIVVEGFKEAGEFRVPNDGEWFWSPQQSKAVQASDEVYLTANYVILEKTD